MKTSAAVLAAIVLAGAGSAQALDILTGNGTIESSDAVQVDRIFRDGVASTWAAPKAFPGTVGGGDFRYDTVGVAFAPNAGQDVYYRISLTNQTDFHPHATAYLNSFDAANLGLNYLGDLGASPGAGVTSVFEVMVGAGGSLLLQFNGNNSDDLGTYLYSYKVEAFSDAFGGENFGAVPEPSAWALMIGGVALAGAALRRRRALAAA